MPCVCGPVCGPDGPVARSRRCGRLPRHGYPHHSHMHLFSIRRFDIRDGYPAGRSRRRTWTLLCLPSLWPGRPHPHPAPAKTCKVRLFLGTPPFGWQDWADCWLAVSMCTPPLCQKQAVQGRGGWRCTLHFCVWSFCHLVMTRLGNDQLTDLQSVRVFWG